MLKTEGANQHCADRPLKSGKRLIADTRQERFYHRNLLPSKALDRSQRCFRYLDCFDGGMSGRFDPNIWHLKLTVGPLSQATFKAVYLSSRVDRNGCHYEAKSKIGQLENEERQKPRYSFVECLACNGESM